MPQSKQHTADLLIMLLLFLVYAGSAIMLCVLGANSYNHTVAVLQEGYNQRSGILYLSQKVHQNDVAGGLRLESYQGNDALVLIEQETGTGYETWIFIQDGYLCEEVIAPHALIEPSQAQRIMPMSSLSLSFIKDNLLQVSVTTDTGAVNAIALALMSSGRGLDAGLSEAMGAGASATMSGSDEVIGSGSTNAEDAPSGPDATGGSNTDDKAAEASSSATKGGDG